MNRGAARNARERGLARLVVAAAVAIGASPAPARDITLAAGAARSESAAAGETRSYRFALGKGQAAELSLHQDDATAIELRWSAPDTAEKTRRTEGGRGSTLHVRLVADTPTTWAIAIGPSVPAHKSDGPCVMKRAACSPARRSGDPPRMPRPRQ